MKPATFDYEVADSVEAALALLARGGGDAKVIAGGQSLVPMLNFRLLKPAVLVDINRIPGLDRIQERDDGIHVGALVRHRRLETDAVIARRLPAVAAAMTHVAHLAIRNRGTIGGSLSHADPAAELPMMALLADAVIEIAAPAGARSVAAEDFFVGTLTTDLGEEELVTGVMFPREAQAAGWGFEEVARRHGDYALAAAAVTLDIEHGLIVQPRIALMGVGETPLRARAAEAVLDGQDFSEALAAEAAEAAMAATEPNTDLHASADYRRHLAGVLVRRALGAAVRRAAEARP